MEKKVLIGHLANFLLCGRTKNTTLKFNVCTAYTILTDSLVRKYPKSIIYVQLKVFHIT